MPPRKSFFGPLRISIVLCLFVCVFIMCIFVDVSRYMYMYMYMYGINTINTVYLV